MRQVLGDESIEVTLGADKGYDASEFFDACAKMKVTPHVTQDKAGRKSAVSDDLHFVRPVFTATVDN